jgi:RNA polymerase primary sigma factor
LATILDLPEDKIKDSISISGRHISMDAPLVSGEESTLYDVMVNKDSPRADKDLIKESLQTEIERTLDTLSEREKEIIKLYFGIGMNHGLTIDEIGEKFDLTRERVRQIKEKALKRLRQSTRSKLLRTYLG